MSARTLPDYHKPPAIETVLGVRFAPLEGWNLLHYGLLLPKFQKEYPKRQVRPPIGQVTFQLAPEADFASFPVRCWFINNDDTQLIQVQNNCFVRNWRKTDQTPDYLHYDVIRPLFKRDWSAFRSFLKEQGLAEPSVWQCEVTYINHFVRGREWGDFTDLHELFLPWRGMSPSGLFAKPEMVSFSTSYSLPDLSGSLQFVSQPAVRKSDGAEILQLTITALGKPASSAEEDVLAWLDKGREAVVVGFTEFTSDRAHKIWGIK